LINEESGCDDFVRAALLFLSFGYECACQLKGSDHGGCDTAVELALAGIDFQTSDGSCNRLALGPAPSDAPHYTPPKKPVNGFVQKLALAGLFAAESR
jgi:hypothetical protein